MRNGLEQDPDAEPTNSNTRSYSSRRPDHLGVHAQVVDEGWMSKSVGMKQISPDAEFVLSDGLVFTENGRGVGGWTHGLLRDRREPHRMWIHLGKAGGTVVTRNYWTPKNWFFA